VKVEFVESGSPSEDLKLVLDFNLHREGGKTHYQKFHEGQYWESVLRPQAKERQRESARRLNQSNDSNLNHWVNESKSQLVKGKRVIQEVSENLNISVGGYHLILTFTSPLPTFTLACALEITLRNAGFMDTNFRLSVEPPFIPALQIDG
jgi:hypothetical protein